MTTALSLQVTNLTTCDRCPAAAKVRYVMRDDTDLIFCAHHSREVQGKITTLPNLQRIDVLHHEN